MAEIVTVSCAATGDVLIVNVAVSAPPATDIEAGTVATDALLVDSDTITPQMVPRRTT